ncbi:SDR family NAD(P)-dependent oxidoreductase [Aminobacter ciceronei]|uniref:NAD(P)-dependent dehydrogenase (Short-subunit alcohol dehydrogenase family) n=1 Tax=Aminobacter ciceronei TaxID=150723 RepID=A0ABR6C665_9HYPH|nr:SDR family NAD(P)-dependent oxidoreductase [Aminobacter ciceronei]MBA8906725.1 NAD(P)-dependent dehydrogenase (short-subunit alcohol dehydrogenase family) [Aminobacter ciceronei]MBA9020504.1 NAD(P)-dependent dehydrogenase (short-subunit alcohol dehydrogenase family) [Aminobacter ciceronei]WMC99636.1 SDR family NAD(P)-dependent oxidoreductase [Aminobacter aminovorans]
MSAPAIRFDGKRVLVTGGASGIGETVARLLSDLGARVVIADLNREQLDPALQRTAAAEVTQGDVASEDDAERMVREAITALGGLDLVFNSAGIGDDLVPVHDQSVERWQRVIDVNLKGTYLMCRAASRPMLRQRCGAIVNVSSIVGLGGFPRRSAYAAAKAGINHLTHTLACEWGPSGIRVNAIAPAYTRTPMVQALLERKAFDPTILERRTPLGRLALPEEMARAAVFLLSDWASYITGTVLPVDGGWSAFGGAGDVVSA